MALFPSQLSECNMIGYRSTHMANLLLLLISDLIEPWKASSVVKTACADRNRLNWMIYCRDHSFKLPAIKAASYRIRTSSDVSLIAFACEIPELQTLPLQDGVPSKQLMVSLRSCRSPYIQSPSQ